MKRVIKDIAVVLSALVLLLLALLYGISPAYKMGFMTNYVFKNISQFNWVELLGSDPVESSLREALGEDKPLSVNAVYEVLREHARNISWEMTDSDAKNAEAAVHIGFDDGSALLDKYADLLTEYVCGELERGNITLEQLPDILDIITDEKNAELLTQAGKSAVSGRLESDAAVIFEKRFGAVYIPQNISAEVYDAVTCGLYRDIEMLPQKVIEKLIPRLLESFFRNLSAFDTDAVRNITGYDIGSALNIEGYPQLSAAVTDFIAQRAWEIKYDVGTYNLETGKISVDCSYSDASGIVENFTASILYYAVTNLFKNPIPDDAALAELFSTSAAAMTDFPRINTTLLFSIDPQGGSFEIPEAIADVASANLVSKLNSVAAVFDPDRLMESLQQQIKIKFPAREVKEFAQQATQDVSEALQSETASQFINNAKDTVSGIFTNDTVKEVFTVDTAVNIMQNLFSMVKR